jgi:4-hydroxy 2-oxovalerate aldolase
MAAGVRVLETTIRDGGYEISHQFTEEDVALVVSTLGGAGVRYIEVGHGMGVGSQQFAAQVRPKQRPSAGDRAHMAAARAAARDAQVGVMLVAGDPFCPVEYVDEVAAAEMDFVRFAFMPGDLTPANMRYVERARARGLVVSINCMQTYILPPDEIARLAAMTRSAGAAWWYVVDSAGGMQPAEVRRYVRALLDVGGLEVGLHAHNNLGLAVANGLAAVEEGATLVDATLNGLGRATGNAPTEQVILALQALGHAREIDVEPIARLAAMYRALFEGKGQNPMHFVSGAAMLHSRNVPAVTAEARARGLSLSDFMVRVGREARRERCLDQFVFPPAVFDRAAAGCQRAGAAEPSGALVGAIASRIAARAGAGLELLCEDLVVRAARHHLPSVLHLVPAGRFPFAGALPWQSDSLVGATAPWQPGAAELAPDRRPDYVVLDPALAGQAGLVPSRRTFTCAWDDLWLDAIRAAVTATSAAGGGGVWLPVPADPELRGVADRLAAAGLPPSPERPADGRAIVVASSDDAARWTGRLAAGDVVIVADRRGRARDVVDAIRRAGAQALAPPIGAIAAARVHELVTLSAALAPRLAAPAASAPWVDPLLAPGTDQAVVDVDLAAIVDDGAQPRDALATKLADARARTLVGGTGLP